MATAGYEAYVYGPNSSSDDLLMVVDSTGAVTHRLLEGPAPHMVLADEDTSKASSDPNRVEWLLGDNQQTVRDQVNDAGTLTDHLVYDSYGNVVSQTTPSNAPRFQYTGMQSDAESGLLYDFKRYYDPKNGLGSGRLSSIRWSQSCADSDIIRSLATFLPSFHGIVSTASHVGCFRLFFISCGRSKFVLAKILCRAVPKAQYASPQDLRVSRAPSLRKLRLQHHDGDPEGSQLSAMHQAGCP